MRSLLFQSGALTCIWLVGALPPASPALFAQAGKPSPQALYESAKALAAAGSLGKAIQNYEAALAADPNFIPGLDELAWIRATSPDARFRNPAEAQRLAGRLVEMTHFKFRRSTGEEFSKSFKVHTTHTLAAAFAANGKFDQAVECALSSVETAQQLRQSDPSPASRKLLAESEVYLKLFRDGHAFIAPEGFSRTEVPIHQDEPAAKK
jgi:tetratricopeptide (TPR) repeat protein